MSDAQTDRELIIRGCEYWVKNHKDESLPLAYSSVVELLALLKEQEAVEPFHRCIGKNFSLIEDSHFDYCPYCGKPITWEGR